MITENLQTLVIHKLTKEQYEQALADGKINPNEIYMTPAEQVGALPVGGVFTDFNAVTEPGLYEADADATIANGPSGYSKFKRCTLLVETMSLGETTQIQQTATYMNVVVKRYSTTGGESWGAWEFVNPPMLSGTEHRTTEKCLDKTVYAKLIKCGEPFDGMSVTPHSSRVTVIRYTGYLTRTGDYGLDAVPVPNDAYSGAYFSFTPDSPDNAIMFHCGEDIEAADPAYTLYLQIWYTK